MWLKWVLFAALTSIFSWKDCSMRSFSKTSRRRQSRLQPTSSYALARYHVPEVALQVIRSAAHGAPLFGWVGDIFGKNVKSVAGMYDVVAYTDSALLRRHNDMGLKPRPLFLPHAVDPRIRAAVDEPQRRVRMAFVATPTPSREFIVRRLASPISLFGRNWRPYPEVNHDVHARRIRKSALPMIYGSHLAALNIRNENNVLAGLNQRSFEPALAGAALVADNQADLPLCFEPGREVYVWNDIDELNEVHRRILREPSVAVAVGQRGLKRVLADHTYGRRLEVLAREI